MRKAIFCMLMLGFATLGFGQTVPQWKVIKVVTRTGITNVSPTTIFTPTKAGTYRVTLTLTQSVADGNAETMWEAAVSWTDHYGVGGLTAVALSNRGYWGSSTAMFNPEVGTAVSYNIFQNQPLESGSHYRLMFTIEQLE